MMGISFPELMVIALVVVMLFGTDKIPELMRSFGKTYRILTDTINEVKREIRKEADDITKDLPNPDKL